MIPSAWTATRRLVPRWRSLAATVTSQELAAPRRNGGALVKTPDEPGEFLHRLERWQLDPGLVTAAELVETAIVEGRERDALDAARRLLLVDENAAPLIRQQAAALLARNGFSDEIPP